MAKRRKFAPIDRALVKRRARGRCEYCQSPEDFESDTFELEHIIPLARNGSNELDNIAYSCSGCNNRKGIKIMGLDPVTLVNVSLFHPRQEVWEDHFQWSGDALRLIGVSPVGRATIDSLDLNRNGCMNLRRALIAIQEHPPTRL
jgi:HNH endonuclease